MTGDLKENSQVEKWPWDDTPSRRFIEIDKFIHSGLISKTRPTIKQLCSGNGQETLQFYACA
jgi:hypothetical protein